MVSVANVRIVESEAVSDAVVGQLDERPQAVGDLAGVKEAHLLRKEQVAILGERAIDRTVRPRGTGVRIGYLRHQTKGRYGIDCKRLTIGGVDSRDLFDIIDHIAIQLEFAPERCQFRKHRVTCSTSHAGLSRKTRYGPAWRSQSAEHDYYKGPHEAVIELDGTKTDHFSFPVRYGHAH